MGPPAETTRCFFDMEIGGEPGELQAVHERTLSLFLRFFSRLPSRTNSSAESPSFQQLTQALETLVAVYPFEQSGRVSYRLASGKSCVNRSGR